MIQKFLDRYVMVILLMDGMKETKTPCPITPLSINRVSGCHQDQIIIEAKDFLQAIESGTTLGATVLIP